MGRPERRTRTTTIHWSDRDYYQFLRCARSFPSLSACVREAVAEWARIHVIPVTDPPATWYQRGDPGTCSNQEPGGGSRTEEGPLPSLNRKTVYVKDVDKGGHGIFGV
jgi:hypothetical protein